MLGYNDNWKKKHNLGQRVQLKTERSVGNRRRKEVTGASVGWHRWMGCLPMYRGLPIANSCSHVRHLETSSHPLPATLALLQEQKGFQWLGALLTALLSRNICGTWTHSSLEGRSTDWQLNSVERYILIALSAGKLATPRPMLSKYQGRSRTW